MPDCLYALQASIPNLTRFGLHCCLNGVLVHIFFLSF